MLHTERKAFVLLSGGIDSTTCLYKAIYDYGADKPNELRTRIYRNMIKTEPDLQDPIPWVEGVSVFYGQRHKREIEYAQASCRALGVEHTTLDIGKILSGAKVMLSSDSIGQVEIPNISYSEIQGVSPTYVPFRNGTLLSTIAAHAQKWINEAPESREAGVYFGAHSEDAANWAYPDCTPEFIGSMANAIYVGTYQKIRLHTPLQWLMKSDIVALGDSLDVDYSLTWSCYAGEDIHCGVCPTCRSRRDAFVIAGVRDPTEYTASPTPEPAAA